MENPNLQSKSAQTPSEISRPSHPFYGKYTWKKWIAIYIIIGVILYGAIYYFHAVKTGSNPYSTTPTSAPQPTPTPINETANWKPLRLIDLSFNIPLSWSYKEQKDSLTLQESISLYPPQASTANGLAEKDADLTLIVHYLPNTTVLAEEQKVRTNQNIKNRTEEIATASAPAGKGFITGKSIYGTYTGSGQNRPKDLKYTYFQYGKDIYSFEFTDVTYTFIKHYDQILSTFRILENEAASEESYLACGCGCCGGVEPIQQCIYKSKGESLTKIQEEDQKTKSNSNYCTVVGCARGTVYKYCD